MRFDRGTSWGAKMIVSGRDKARLDAAAGELGHRVCGRDAAA
ncbi:hypothetical protein [Nocardia sp. NPDC004750]